MARIRTVKPEIWASEQFVDCSRNARLLFIGMLNFADDRGVLKFSARTIRGHVFPMDDDINAENVLGMIRELIKNGLVGVFEAQGAEYLHILTFAKHQRVDKPNPKHPQPPRNPAGYKEWSANDLGTNGDLFAERSPAEGKGREGSLRERKGREELASARARESFDPPQPEPSETATEACQQEPEPPKGRVIAMATTLGREVLGIVGYDADAVSDFAEVQAWLERGDTPSEIRAAAHAIAPRMKPGVRAPLRWIGKALPDEIAAIRRADGGAGFASVAKAPPPDGCTGWRAAAWNWFGEVTFRSWVEPAQESRAGNVVELRFPTPFKRDWARDQLGDRLAQFIRAEDPTVERVEFKHAGEPPGFLQRTGT